MPPTFGHGKVCYLDIPALDIATSAEFYRKVFGWQSRRRDDGSLGFDDGVGQVSGSWSVGRPPSVPGIVISIMVDDAATTCEAIVAEGCEIVQPIGAEAPEITAHFRDPGGNVLGVYQDRS